MHDGCKVVYKSDSRCLGDVGVMIVDCLHRFSWAKDLYFSEVVQYGVDQFESLIDLLTNFRAGQDNLPTHENEEYNLGLHHSVDETRKELRLVRREMVMTRGETFETNGELDVARTHNVLDLEVYCIVNHLLRTSAEGKLRTCELGIEAQFLDDASILAT